jgi:ketosteroid isomerase-like protein
MSRENVDAVRSMYAGFSRLVRDGGVASYVREHYDPDCVYRPIEEPGAIRGRDALIRWIERWLEAWEEYADEIDEIDKAGDLVFAAVWVHGRGRGTGAEISQRFFHVFEMREHKILRLDEYLSRREALEAAGLSE